MERDEILSKLRERIVAFAASRLGRDTAEDVAQEVLMVLQERYARVTRLEELAPLAFQITRFKMAGLRRKAARRGESSQVQVDDLPLAAGDPDPADQYERREMLERLRAALAGMEARCRELFRLKLEGRTFSQIQATLGARSINTVYTWDARCRKRLLERMGGSWER